MSMKLSTGVEPVRGAGYISWGSNPALWRVIALVASAVVAISIYVGIWRLVT